MFKQKFPSSQLETNLQMTAAGTLQEVCIFLSDKKESRVTDVSHVWKIKFPKDWGTRVGVGVTIFTQVLWEASRVKPSTCFEELFKV